jgi:hypothetical protein
MDRLLFLTLWLFITVQESPAQTHGFQIRNGVLYFHDESGQERKIAPGNPCADLWVSPDESVIAFITVDSRTPEAEGGYVLATTVFVAKEAENYSPVRVPLEPVSFVGRKCADFRQPSISPDLRSLHFLAPVTMRDWWLMRVSLATGRAETLATADEYCVIWGGQLSGGLLFRARDDHAHYPCHLRDQSGGVSRAADQDECGDFGNFAARFSAARGGSCTPPAFTHE